jgi:hypothetical protein
VFLDPQHTDWAAVALFYAADQWVHSSLADEPDLPKDERHPRKHTAPAGEDTGGRGTNQLVRDLFPEIHVQYRSLMEASHRTRYDFEQLGAMAWPLLQRQYGDVRAFCRARNATRPTRSTQEP